MTQQLVKTENDPRWARVVARDAAADGQFYYSVKTMGVYCRPSCPSRLARPENVSFHPTCEDAEQAGFRPCKRCKPRNQRLEIRYAIGECSLGSILVAATRSGVCALLMGDDLNLLPDDLQGRFPHANLIRADRELAALLSQVTRFLDAPAAGLDVTLDIRGTAFQQRVWRALLEIQPGNTATYSEIANRIGSPSATRAVALACGANPLAVVIPCHRVIRSDGALSGYRWGVERKEALLRSEARL